MIPIQVNGNWTIAVKVIADFIGGALGGFLPLLCVIIVTVSAVAGVASIGKPSFITSYPVVNDTFSATPVWAVVRVVGAVFAWLTFLQVGEEGSALYMISGPDSGGFVLHDLLSMLVVIFLLAGLLLPLLLDFGNEKGEAAASPFIAIGNTPWVITCRLLA